LAERGVGIEGNVGKSIVRLQDGLISKAAYDAIGGHDESLWISMDLDLSFRLMAKYPIAYIDEVVFLYRKHEGNTGSNEELRLTENIRVIEKLLREFPAARDLLGASKIARRLAYRHYRLAKGRRKRGRASEARESMRQAVALCPGNLKYRLFQMAWGLAGQSQR
jgi:hypothetical protein